MKKKVGEILENLFQMNVCVVILFAKKKKTVAKNTFYNKNNQYHCNQNINMNCDIICFFFFIF